MDKLWDLDVEIQLAASQIDHGLEIFIISEPSGATLDVLYDAVHPFQNGIRIGVLEIVQDLVPMIADRATKLLHGFQSCVHHPAAELFQTLLRLVSMDGLLVDFLQFDAHGTGTRCLLRAGNLPSALEGDMDMQFHGSIFCGLEFHLRYAPRVREVQGNGEQASCIHG